jgi:O-antigen/teichoic acid export membrane protein
MSTSYKEKNFKKLQEISQNTFKLLLVFWAWVIALWTVFKKYIILLIANKDYLEQTSLNHFTSANAFDVVFFMLLFFYLWLVFSYLLVATERQNRLLKISIILTIVNIIWNIILIPYLSFIWAWIVTVFTQILFLVLAYFFSRDIFKFKFPIKYIVLVIFSAWLLHIIAKYLNSNLSLWGYYNLIYAFWLFFLYIWSFWYFEYRKLK